MISQSKAGLRCRKPAMQRSPHPEEARSAVSKGGQHRDWFPPFETPRYARLLRVTLCLLLGRDSRIHRNLQDTRRATGR